MSDALWIIMPAYNEAATIECVIRKWMDSVRAERVDFVFCVLDDGSSDATPAIVSSLSSAFPELRLITKKNSGHGQTCIFGYRTALSSQADWILQIDSDGQCDPRYFGSLWRERNRAIPVYGFRRVREDGSHRFWLSRMVSIVGWLAFRVWVRDPNVPYRLMHRSSLETVVDRVPKDVHLANVLVAILQQQSSGIRWHDISFRKRKGGTPTVRSLSFVRAGLNLFRQLLRARLGYERNLRARTHSAPAPDFESADGGVQHIAGESRPRETRAR